jgi:hypothetical protein
MDRCCSLAMLRCYALILTTDASRRNGNLVLFCLVVRFAPLTRAARRYARFAEGSERGARSIQRGEDCSHLLVP